MSDETPEVQSGPETETVETPASKSKVKPPVWPSTQAVLRNIKSSPQKLNLVAQQVRGKPVTAALNVLRFSKKKVAVDVLKTLQSAIANAENNHGLDVDQLYVREAYVGKNMTLKRFHARARGRGARVLKHYSQVTVIVEERGEAA
jgi:large subunit ribosomal protein L22